MSDARLVRFKIEDPGIYEIAPVKSDRKTDRYQVLILAVGENAVAGLILKVHRDRFGLTVASLASASGISSAMICRIENGQRQFDADLLNKLSKSLPGLERDLKSLNLVS